MIREQVIERMAAHLDAEVNKTRHEEDWEPSRIAEELLDIVVPSKVVGTVRTFVKVDGELAHDETYVNEVPEIGQISYPGLTVYGQKVEVGFEFDPPLVMPAAPSED